MLRTGISYFCRNTALASHRKPASPRYVVAELRSSNTPTKGGLILRKDKYPRTRLIQAIHAGVKATDDQDNITSMVEKSLDAFIPHITQPQHSYETVIRFLLSRKCIPAVLSVYSRMTEVGFAVPLRLEARILVSLIVNTPSTEEKILQELGEALQDIVRNKGFTDEDLWNIMTLLNHHNFSSDLLLYTMNNFYDTHETKDSTLDIRLYKRFLHQGTESGNVEAGLRSLATLGHSRIWGPRRFFLVNKAYASFIAGVRDTPHPNRDAIGSALKLMAEQGVRPNIYVVNALISFEVHTNSLHRAFAIYNSVKNDGKIRPDDFTFGSLFNVLNRLYNPKRKTFRGAGVITGVIPSPRTLYREMIEAILQKSTRLAFEPSTSLLNVVLRSFIYKTDYVGALVALQCFTAFRVPVNVITYKLVLTHLMNRITYWIRAYRKMGDDKWADRFLSLPYPILDPTFLAKLQLGDPLMARILDVCKRSGFNLDWPLFAHKWQNGYQDVPVEYRVPSIKYILGRVPVSLDDPFDVEPLERLLRKAIFCEVESMRELGYGEAAHAYISKMVEDAKVEMVPPELDARLEELGKQRKEVESEKETFEGFTERRKSRKAQRGKVEGAKEDVVVDETEKGEGERQEDVEAPDAVDSEKANKETFEGYTKRRKRRKAQRGNEEDELAALAIDEVEKGAGEREEGVEAPDAVVDETQRDPEGEGRDRVMFTTVDEKGIRVRIWTNQKTSKSRKRRMRRKKIKDRNAVVVMDKAEKEVGVAEESVPKVIEGA